MSDGYALPNSFDITAPSWMPQQPMGAGIAAFSQPNATAYMAPPASADTSFNWTSGGAGAANTWGGNTAAPAGGSWWGGQPGVAGDGMRGWLGNANNLATVFQGIGALTQAYLGFKQLAMAKDAFKLQKEAYRTNLRNSTQTYNTSLEDRIRGRTSNYTGKEADVQAYLAQNSLHTGG